MTAGQSHNKDADTPVEVRGYKTDPLRRGYQILWNYENVYWRALVGSDAWSLYEVLRSFCHEKNNTCYPSINLLLAILGLQDRRVLTGRVKEVKGKQYKYPGLIENLQEHQLVIAEIEGEGPKMRYIFHVNLTPGLLNEDQLSQLPKLLQRKHTELLERCEQAKRDMEAKRRPPKVRETALETLPSPSRGPDEGPAPNGSADPEQAEGEDEGAVEVEPDNIAAQAHREDEAEGYGKFPEGGGYGKFPEGPDGPAEGMGNSQRGMGNSQATSGNFPGEHYPVNNIKETTAEEQKNNNRRSENIPNQNVVVALTDLGISERVAKRLANHYSQKRVLEKIDFLTFLQETDSRKINNPRGWLRTAIEENYGPPDGYQPKEQREAEAAERERRRRDIALGAAEGHEQSLVNQGPWSARLGAWQKWVAETHSIPQNLLHITDQLLESLKLQMPAATYQAWVVSTMITELGESQARIAVSSSRAYDWLDHRLKPKFEQTLAGIIDRQVDVVFEVLERSPR